MRISVSNHVHYTLHIVVITTYSIITIDFFHMGIFLASQTRVAKSEFEL